MSEKRRARRVGEMIRQEVSWVLQNRVRDQRAREAVISEVEVAADVKTAWIYFVCPAGRQADILAGLTQAAGFIRREAAARLELKFMPELIFRHDESLDRGEAIDRLISDISKGEGA